MTYDVRDQSVHDGEPIECFKFVGTLGTYRYTDNPVEVTVNGELYEPMQITRSTVEVGSVIGSIQSMDFDVPFDCVISEVYSGLITPEELRVEVRRVHRGDDYATMWKMIWRGKAIGYSLSGRIFTIGTMNKMQTDLSASINSIYYQTTCNHILFDERCKVNRAANSTVSTVVAISDDAVEVVDDGVIDNDLRAGEIVNQRTGERRLVLSNLANVITIGYAFIDIIPGDTVTMVRGCNHSFTECNVKFDNLDNYGGFMYVPTKNPFTNGV